MALWGRKPQPEQSAQNGQSHAQNAAPDAVTPDAVTPAAEAEFAAQPAMMDSQPTAQPDMAPQAAAPGSALSQEELERRAVASKRLLMSFGEIVSVMMRSPQFKTATLSDLEHLVVPAVSSGQFIVAEAQSKENGFITPVSVALWATVSDEVDQRLASNPEEPIKLAPQEWKSGDNPWLIALAGDRRPMNTLLRRLHETTFKDKPLKVRTRGEDGRHHVKTFTPAAEG